MADVTNILGEFDQKDRLGILEQYDAFIDAVELELIALRNITAKLHPEKISDGLKIELSDQAETTLDDGKMVIDSRHMMIGKSGRSHALKIDVTFRLIYDSPLDVHPGVVKLFEIKVLPLNVWPFVRELFHETTGRMGLPPLTLPLIKR